MADFLANFGELLIHMVFKAIYPVVQSPDVISHVLHFISHVPEFLFYLPNVFFSRHIHRYMSKLYGRLPISGKYG